VSDSGDAAWGLGLGALLLALLGGAEAYNYILPSALDNLTPTDFGVFTVIALVAAVAFYVRGQRWG